MNGNRNFACLIFLTLSLLFACDNSPRVIEAQTTADNIQENHLPVFQEVSNDKIDVESHGPKSKPLKHEVQVEDILTTEKYAYLKVKEGTTSFWIAISKREVQIGEVYQFEGGLLKRNFYSREFDRVFDTVYLVSKLWKKNNPMGAGLTVASPVVNKEPNTSTVDLSLDDITPVPGAVRLAELFATPEKYQDQKITITGKCVKVNPRIMKRNWLHIQDGSGKDLDLTVTTQEDIPLGAIVSMEGTIALKKDFGAGYRYELIMEEAISK